MLNVAPMANPSPSATKETISPTIAYKPKRKYWSGSPDIQYVSTRKIKLNNI